MGRAAQAHAERRARWAVVRGGNAPRPGPEATPATKARARLARPARLERVTIADDGTRTEKGKDACI